MLLHAVLQVTCLVQKPDPDSSFWKTDVWLMDKTIVKNDIFFFLVFEHFFWSTFG